MRLLAARMRLSAAPRTQARLLEAAGCGADADWGAKGRGDPSRAVESRVDDDQSLQTCLDTQRSPEHDAAAGRLLKGRRSMGDEERQKLAISAGETIPGSGMRASRVGTKLQDPRLVMYTTPLPSTGGLEANC